MKTLYLWPLLLAPKTQESRLSIILPRTRLPECQSTAFSLACTKLERVCKKVRTEHHLSQTVELLSNE
jgi:hypothetical protein